MFQFVKLIQLQVKLNKFNAVRVYFIHEVASGFDTTGTSVVRPYDLHRIDLANEKV